MDLGYKEKAQDRPKSRVGLDIGSYAVKIIELSQTGSNKATVAGSAIKKVGAAVKGELADLVKAAALEARISLKDAAISISGPAVITRFITMPRMSDEDLRGAIRFEAEKFIPFNINDCIVDFQVLRKEKGGGKLDILLVAAKKDAVWERVKLAEAAGFSVALVDVDSFAASNSFLANFPNAFEKEKTVALLNIGAKFTNLNILTNGQLAFVRDVAIGGGDFTAAISKGLGVDAKSAEELKRSPADKTKEVADSIRAALNNLLDELKLSFSYHENQSGRSIDEVYISGGGAGLAGLDQAFLEAFGSKPIIWDPLQFLNTKSENSNSFAVATGLALRR